MAQKSIILKKNHIDKFIKILDKKNIAITEGVSEYEIFRVNTEDLFLILYRTGSLVFKDSKAVQNIFKALKSELESELYYDYYIGSDETGKGEWYGPLVVVAACLNPQNIIDYRFSGFKDSKKFNREEISELFSKIDDTLKRKSVILNPLTLSEKCQEFFNEGQNYNDILAWMHSRAIFDLLETIDAENNQIQIVIDKFDFLKLDKRLKKYQNNPNVKIIQKTKGETETEVAVASVIAKEVFEKTIEEYQEKFQLNVRNIDLGNVPLEILPQISKEFFKNVQKRKIEAIIEKYFNKIIQLIPELKKFEKSRSDEDILYLLKKFTQKMPLLGNIDNFLELYKTDSKSEIFNPELTINLEKKIQEMVLKLEATQKELNKKEKMVDDLKGSKLENDSRTLLHKKYYFTMRPRDINFSINKEDQKLLIENECIKDENTKDIELDLIGERISNGNFIHCIGECKTSKKQMSLEEFKCFMIKASIYAKWKIEGFKKEHKKKEKLPEFEIFIISLNGFKFDIDKINRLKFWDLGNKRIKEFHFLFGNDLLKKFKDANIPIKHYKELIKNGDKTQ